MRIPRFFRVGALLTAVAALGGCRSAVPEGKGIADRPERLEIPPMPLSAVDSSDWPEDTVLADVAGLYVLRWNPAVSSFKEETFREGFERLRRDGRARTNWSLHDWENVKEGDWALFARVGGEDGAGDGIAGLCRFGSEAYEGVSWRGDGAMVHYADIDILLFNDPASTGLFGSEELAPLFPGIDWHGGPSGVRVDSETAARLARHIAARLAGVQSDGSAREWPEDAFAVSGGVVEELVADLSPGVGFTPDDAAFAVALLGTSAGEGRNGVVSPCGAEAAIALLALGARGDTEWALLDAFGAYSQEFWGERVRRAADTVPGVEIETSLSLWLPEELGVAPGYAAQLGGFGVPLQTAPMDEDGRGHINGFVAEATHGRVEELVPSPLDGDSGPLALHTLYFKARWLVPFGADDTVESVFHAPGGDVRVPFMNVNGGFVRKQLPGSGWSALILPYEEGALEMVLLIPPREAAPGRMADELADVLAAEWIADGGETPVFLTMPMFSLSASNDGLERALVAIGAGIALGPAADFSGIVPAGGLDIGRILQQVRVDVDEAGTEAASANAAVAEAADMPETRPERILLNRPFAFAVRDARTGMVLVLGQVFDPSVAAR